MERIKLVTVDILATRQTAVGGYRPRASGAPASSWPRSTSKISIPRGGSDRSVDGKVWSSLCIQLGLVNFEFFGGLPIVLNGVYFYFTCRPSAPRSPLAEVNRPHTHNGQVARSCNQATRQRKSKLRCLHGNAVALSETESRQMTQGSDCLSKSFLTALASSSVLLSTVRWTSSIPTIYVVNVQAPILDCDA